ncbi:MAG TPA: 50S ribosomal protein L11 methyltransferase [Candidatus Binatia bacterium]|nr:50S ribosomal protein L11 methyltransferase [Candidatus Binatia bacterium]
MEEPFGPGAWLELAVEADLEAVEVVSEILARVSSGGIAVETPFVPEVEGLAARPDPTRPAVVRGYLPARDEVTVRAAVATVEDALGHLIAFGLRPIGELRTRVVREADWASAWKRHFPVLRIGRRLVVRPTWRRYRAGPDDVVLALDPGMAFGTGLHPTTRLCLLALEGLGDGGALGSASRVLDLGSGSGILGIAAAKLGAGSVLALDTDPIAVEATTANARRNGLARRIEARQGSLPSGAEPFDVVLANLVASLLVELAPRLAAEVVPGGRVVASGIIDPRAAEVAAAFADVGLSVEERLVDGDWVALIGRRR